MNLDYPDEYIADLIAEGCKENVTYNFINENIIFITTVHLEVFGFF